VAAGCGAACCPKGDACDVPGGPKGEGEEPKGDAAGFPNGDCPIEELGCDADAPKGEGLGAPKATPVTLAVLPKTDVMLLDDGIGATGVAKGDGAVLPKAVDDGPGAGIVAAASSGLGTLYFFASFANISTSLPLYFSSVLSTSFTLAGLCLV
jgi:hypothetical protein